jgi:integrase
LPLCRCPHNGKNRELPLHPSTLAALSTYASQRERLCPDPQTAGFFVSPAGARLILGTVQRTFSRLARQAGLTARSRQCRPRLHDLRHSFACRVVLGWYRDGLDVDAQMPRLSTYLGHADPSGTYWYLSAVPELLALAAERRDHIPGRRA